jgi:hypothetical protein
MSTKKWLVCGVLAAAVAASVTAPLGATTLIRQGLDKLVADNATIVVGQVVDYYSYWNDDHTFILTDVRFATEEVLKGRVSGDELTITVMGGQVGDLTTLIVGGPVLEKGQSYLLFLNHESLPGVDGALTVRDLVQGAFDIVVAKDGLRAVSQANGHPLLADWAGNSLPPGEEQGVLLNEMSSLIRDLVRHSQGVRPEVR